MQAAAMFSTWDATGVFDITTESSQVCWELERRPH
jgi:hypothetical protein